MQRYEHGGNVDPERNIIDFSANINPLGLPDWVRPLINSSIDNIIHYPDPDNLKLRTNAAKQFKRSVKEIIFGNGSSELLTVLPKTLNVKRVLIFNPSYSEYERSAIINNLSVKAITLLEDDSFSPDYSKLQKTLKKKDLIFLGHPNNPTGKPLDVNKITKLAKNNPTVFFVIDESFIDFIPQAKRFIQNKLPNIITIYSFTKIYAIPGLRLGMMIANTNIIKKMKKLLAPWSVNSIASAVGIHALKDKTYIKNTKKIVKQERDFLTSKLQKIKELKVFPSEANFLLIKLIGGKFTSKTLKDKLLKQSIAIRNCDNFSCLEESFIRVAVKTHEENEKLFNIFYTLYHNKRTNARKKKKTKAIMFQGTSSNAGKSILTAAFCRILLKKGISVAPFKAQNMSLNSFVTKDGLEMGRAQVVQAKAALVLPDVRMNPILIKPSKDTQAQIILNGKPVKNMDVSSYIDYKKFAFDAVKTAYDSLSEDYEAIVLEGAGSPGEVNLKKHDIVNMPMAKYANCPVLLVGDIDRGGVFASFIGTVATFNQWERDLLKGFIVNKFRGDASLLKDAYDYTKKFTSKPVLGTIPFIKNVGLPEEDSVEFRDKNISFHKPESPEVTIALIDLPHISNFTDIDPFLIEEDVLFKTIKLNDSLKDIDILIIPGSKNIFADLQYLRNSSLADKIIKFTDNKSYEIVGLCGGFQMLGTEITDKFGVESNLKRMKGLGLLNITTSFSKTKTLKQVKARFLDAKQYVEGYEIHHGVTSRNNEIPVIKHNTSKLEGAKSIDKNVWGTYLHGIFDNDDFRRWFIDRARVRKGIKPLGQNNGAKYDIEPAIDRLSEIVAQNMDVDKILKIMEL